MKALIYKDFSSLKKSIMILLAIIFLLCLYFGLYFGKEQLLFIPMIFTFGESILLKTAFVIDYKYDIDKYLVATGIKKEKIVLSRYTMVFLASILAMGFGLFIHFLFARNISMSTFLILAIIFFITSFMGSIELPLIYKFGIEKINIVFTVFYLFVVVLFSVIANKQDFIAGLIRRGLSINENTLALAISLFTLLMLGLSIGISIKIYQKKEF